MAVTCCSSARMKQRRRRSNFCLIKTPNHFQNRLKIIRRLFKFQPWLFIVHLDMRLDAFLDSWRTTACRKFHLSRTQRCEKCSWIYILPVKFLQFPLLEEHRTWSKLQNKFHENFFDFIVTNFTIFNAFNAKPSDQKFDVFNWIVLNKTSWPHVIFESNCVFKFDQSNVMHFLITSVFAEVYESLKFKISLKTFQLFSNFIQTLTPKSTPE